MSYEIHFMEAKFKIEKENIEKAYELLDKKGYNDNYIHDDLFDMFEDHSDWSLVSKGRKNHSDIIDIEFEGSYYKVEDEEMFACIAPCVENGSYIQIVGEDGELFRWTFNNGVFKEIHPKITWEPEG